MEETTREKSLDWFFGKNEIEKQELKEKYFPNTFIQFDSHWGYYFTFEQIEEMYTLSNKCETCNGTGLVEGMEFDDVYSCSNCLGKGILINNKIMNWTEPKPPKQGISYYNYITCETPLGKAIIEWKSWKDNTSYDLEIDGKLIACEYSLDDAKEKALEYLVDKEKDLNLFLNGY